MKALQELPILPSVTLERMSRQPVCKFSRLSRKLPESFWIAESFWTGWKVSRQYLHFGTYIRTPFRKFCAWKIGKFWLFVSLLITLKPDRIGQFCMKYMGLGLHEIYILRVILIAICGDTFWRLILLTKFAWNIWRYFCGEAFKEFSTQLNSRGMISSRLNGWWCF